MSDRSLILRFQQLTEVPEWVWERTDVAFPCLSGNRLTAIPDAIARLAGLRALDMSLPETISGLESLIEFRAYNNGMTTPPDAIGSLPRLCELHLSNNALIRVEHAPRSARLHRSQIVLR